MKYFCIFHHTAALILNILCRGKRQEKHNLGRKPHVVISHCHYCQGLVHLQSGACREDDGRLGDSRGCWVISSELIRIVIRNSRHSQFAGISHLRLLQPPNMSQFKENSHNLWRSQLLGDCDNLMN